jgi:hypothetical protein
MEEHMNVPGLFNDIFSGMRLPNTLLQVFVFYFNYYVVIPRLYLQDKYLSVAGVTVGYFLVLFVANNISFHKQFGDHFHPGGPGPDSPPGPSWVGPDFNLFMLMNVYVFSFAISLYSQWRKAKREKTNAEIAFLKAQINPHFLFNTLNSIYSLSLSKSDTAPDAIVKLSSMMRYTVSDAAEDFTALDKEINYIINYIDLQKLRLSPKVKFSFTIDGNPAGKRIAPLILIPFVENAFKHGVNAEEDSEIRISIHITEYDIRLQVFNNKVYVNRSTEPNTGLGITSTERRLHLLYPGKHLLSITDDDQHFNVLLHIHLQ